MANGDLSAPSLTSQLVLDTAQFEAGLDEAESRLGNFRSFMQDYADGINALGNVSLGAGLAAGAGLTPGVIGAQRLEQALARTFSVGEQTEAQMHRVRHAVMDLGTSAVGPVRLAESLFDLASVGLDVEEQLTVLPEVMRLSVASGYELTQVSSLLVQAMRAFRLEAADAARISNVVSASNANSASNVQRLADAFRFAAPVAASLGLELEETTAGLNILMDVLQRGEQAGTSFRTLMASLANPLPRLTAAANEAGISLNSLNPQEVGLESALQNLQTLFDNGANSLELFGQEAANAADILGAGADRFAEMEAAITGTNETQRQFDVQMQTSINRLRRLLNTITVTATSFGRGFLPVFNAGVEALRIFVEALNAIPTPIKAVIGALTGLGAAYLIINGVVLKVTAALFNWVAAGRAAVLVQAQMQRAMRGAASLWGDVTTAVRNYITALRSSTVAGAAYARTKQRQALVVSTAANAQASAETRAAAAAGAANARRAASANTATATVTAAYTAQQVRTNALRNAMQALRNAAATLFGAFRGLGRVLKVLAFNKFTAAVVAALFALREMARFSDILAIAGGELSQSFQEVADTLHLLGPLFSFLSNLISTVALVAVGSLALLFNDLASAIAGVNVLLQTFGTLLNPRNWGRANEVLEEHREKMDAINERYQEARDNIARASREALSGVWSENAVTGMDAVREELDLTEEEMGEAMGTVGEFRDAFDENLQDLVFDVDATPVQRQLRSIDEDVRSRLQGLEEFARENPLIMHVDMDGEAVEEVGDSMYAALVERVEEAAQTARDVIIDDFVDGLQREADQAWVNSLDEGTEKIRAEYELRREALQTERREAIQSVGDDWTAVSEIEQVFFQRLQQNRQDMMDSLAEYQERMAEGVREAEDRLVNAQVDAMDDGIEKIRLQAGLEIREIRRRTQDRLEAMEEGSAEYQRTLQIQAQLEALIREQMLDDMRDFTEEQRALVQDSAEQYRQAITTLRDQIADLRSLDEGAYGDLVSSQLGDIREAREQIHEELQTIRDDLDEGVIDAAEAQQRRSQILALAAEREAALYRSQREETQQHLAEEEAAREQHTLRLRELYAELAQVTAEGAVEAAQIQRRADLAQLESWYAERRAAAEGNREQLLRVEEEYQARRSVILARGRQAQQQAQQEQLEERLDAEEQLLRRLDSGGIAGVVRVDDLETARSRLEAVREELVNTGAAAEDIALVDQAIGGVNRRISELHGEGIDDFASAMSSIEEDIAGLEEDLGRGPSAEEQLQDRIEAWEQELEERKRNLRNQYGATDAYHRAVEALEEAHQQRVTLARDAHAESEAEAQEERERERLEEVRRVNEELGEEIATARVELISGDLARAEAEYRQQARQRRQAFQDDLDELRLTNEERLQITQRFRERERLLEVQHQRELREIRRDQVRNAMEDYRDLDAELQRLREDRARTAAAAEEQQVQGQINETRDLVEVRQEAIASVREEIEALRARNKELDESISSVATARSYYEQVRELFGQVERRPGDPPAKTELEYAEEQLDVAEQLYRQAVDHNAPLSTRRDLLNELISLHQDVVDLGGEGVDSDLGLVREAERVYEQAAEEADGAASMRERNVEALEALQSQLDDYELSLEGLNDTLEALNETLQSLNEEADQQVWSQLEGRFLDLGEAAEEARARYRDALAGIFADLSEGPTAEASDFTWLVDRVQRYLDSGDIETFVRQYGRNTGRALPAGVLEGILEAPVPGSMGETLAEQLGIEDTTAYIEELGRQLPERYLTEAASAAREPVDGEEVTPELSPAEELLRERTQSMGETAGRGLMEAFAAGISANEQVLLTAVENALTKVRELLPSSDAKRGPLSTLTSSGRALVDTFTRGAQAREGELSKRIGGIFANAQPPGLSGGAPGAVRRHPYAPGAMAQPITMYLDGRREAPAGPLAMDTRRLVRDAQREIRWQGG